MVIDSYISTRVVFGPGRLNELGTLKLPGKKALVCITEDRIMEKLGILPRVKSLLEDNNTEFVVFDKVKPNPTRQGVMEAARIAKESSCDFFIGLGGGSSIDTAKAAAIMMVNEGDLWDYASAGTGGGKEVNGAFPVVTISTTAGTGTECDPWCVITNEETREKLDFGVDAVYPVISIIDPELTVSLPYDLTCYQGFDGLFHAFECYLATCGNELAKVYSLEAIRILSMHLPVLAEMIREGNTKPEELIEERSYVMYATNVLCGFAQSLSATISPHIIGQCMGGLHGGFPHGATLLVTAEEYYKTVADYLPDEFELMASAMGNEAAKDIETDSAFVKKLVGLMESTEMRYLPMSGFGVAEDELEKIADISLNVGFDFDPYDLTKEQVLSILRRSYR